VIQIDARRRTRSRSPCASSPDSHPATACWSTRRSITSDTGRSQAAGRSDPDTLKTYLPNLDPEDFGKFHAVTRSPFLLACVAAAPVALDAQARAAAPFAVTSCLGALGAAGAASGWCCIAVTTASGAPMIRCGPTAPARHVPR